jgi:type IV secretion/conjugal transfer VirB4 family ATPase
MLEVASPRYANQVAKERQLARFLPYSSHVASDVVVTRAGDLIRCWKVEGIPFDTVDADDIALRKEQLNTALLSIGSDKIALWTHIVRHRWSDRLNHGAGGYSQAYHEAYSDMVDGTGMMRNDLYLTVVYRPSGNGGFGIASRIGRSREEIEEARAIGLKALNELSVQLEANLSRYELTRLGLYEFEGAVCSDLLEFWNFLASGVWQRVRVPHGPIAEGIGNAWISVGAETVELRTPVSQRFAQFFDIKDYVTATEGGMINALMYQPIEFVISQSFCFMNKSQARGFLKRQQNQLMNANDGSNTQVQEITDAIDELIQGNFSLGQYHFVAGIFSDNPSQCEAHRVKAMAVMADLGFVAALVDTATDAAFFSQFPGNFFYRPRLARITSRNFAGLSSLHNFASGKRNGNPWGEAVSLLSTPSGQPFYFNFHFAKEGDQEGDKVLGNTRIIGMSGSGKTVLLAHLLLEAQKFGAGGERFNTVFFDKDRGAELLIRRLGGKYLAVKNGRPTGFNPFQMEPSPENLLFLERLVKVLATRGNGDSLSAADEARIAQAVRSVMLLPHDVRRLSVLLQNLTEGLGREERENSLVRRLAPWCYDDGTGRRGALCWALDCPTDQIDFGSHTNYGVDGTDFLDNDEVRTPISMYLLHRMEEIIDGRRFIYFMDEAWKWVDDPAFAEFAGNKQLTIRKQNGLGVFATQMPSSLLLSPIAASLVQQCATEIYLPNPKAVESEYVGGFKLTQTEFEIVRMLKEDSRMFLVKQGNDSALCRLTLKGFDRFLAIMSGSTDNTELLDAIRGEHGDDPDVWEPIFHERRA